MGRERERAQRWPVATSKAAQAGSCHLALLSAERDERGLSLEPAVARRESGVNIFCDLLQLILISVTELSIHILHPTVLQGIPKKKCTLNNSKSF